MTIFASHLQRIQTPAEAKQSQHKTNRNGAVENRIRNTIVKFLDDFNKLYDSENSVEMGEKCYRIL